MLRAKTVELGWAERAIEADPVLRGLFDAYVNRSVNSTIWYKKQNGIPHTASDVAIIKEQRTFLLLLNLDADHDFLFRIDELRKHSLRESGKKQWLAIKSNPQLYAKYKQDAKEAYAKKKMLERESGLQVVFEEMSAESEFENWLELYRAARKKMPKI